MKNKILKTALTICVVIGVSILFSNCKKDLKYKDVILITGTEVSDVINFAVDGVPSKLAITASATKIVDENINVNFSVDTMLLAGYNAKNKTNFIPLPAGSYRLSTGSSVIKAGGHVSDPVAIEILSTDKLVDGRNYMVPVVLGVSSGSLSVLSSSSTAFVKINRVVTNNVADITNGPTIVQTFSKPTLSLTKFTFEFRVNVAQFASTFRISTVANFGGGPQDGVNTFNLFRFGELSDEINQLQWINTDGKVSSRTLFATNTWYTISCVYDGTSCNMYVNGKLDASFNAAAKTYLFDTFRLGSDQQRVAGQISEIRLWNRALSSNEITNNFCGVDPTDKSLVAYWKCNDGTGNKITDYSGNGYTLIADSPFTWIEGVKCPN